MNPPENLAERFEEHRPRLKAVAYRMLGSLTEAEDAVQEAWLRLSGSDGRRIDNLGGWLTTVVGRVCLDLLRTRKRRGEEPLEDRLPDPVIGREDRADPEHQALVADSVGLALLVVLDSLNPAERLAFVLHDMFGLSFEEIAPIVDRTPQAARKLASRARLRVRGATPPPDPDRSGQRRVVDAFLAAARGGDFDGLVALLDPEVTLRADGGALTGGCGRSAVPPPWPGSWTPSGGWPPPRPRTRRWSTARPDWSTPWTGGRSPSWASPCPGAGSPSSTSSPTPHVWPGWTWRPWRAEPAAAGPHGSGGPARVPCRPRAQPYPARRP